MYLKIQCLQHTSNGSGYMHFPIVLNPMLLSSLELILSCSAPRIDCLAICVQRSGTTVAFAGIGTVGVECLRSKEGPAEDRAEGVAHSFWMASHHLKLESHSWGASLELHLSGVISCDYMNGLCLFFAFLCAGTLVLTPLC